MKAFPRQITFNNGISQGKWIDDGMELRDYFAIKILQSLIPVDNKHNPDSWDFRISMEDAYQMADAMMEARKENK
jgi:hypothetical protein